MKAFKLIWNVARGIPCELCFYLFIGVVFVFFGYRSARHHYWLHIGG